MGKKALNLTIFSLILLLLLPLVAMLYRIGDGEDIFRCKSAEASAVMLGGDDPTRPHYRLLPGETLDINSASAEALLALPGIDKVLAERIVEHRQLEGDYGSIEDIMDVYGIGKGRFEDMKEHIRTGDDG